MKLDRLGEFGLIEKISKLLPKSKKVILGVGDDAAAVRCSPDKIVLITCDPVIEGIHFAPSTKPFEIGWKAMARNLSDIAAMGGTPTYAVVSAALPRRTTLKKALQLHRGISAAAKCFGVYVVGGDTAHTEGPLQITVTLLGEIKKKELVARAGAKSGHALCVTGTLGGSILGKHLRFTPRVSEARFLASHFHPSSMIDLSDGLSSDLQRLSEQSRVGFEVWNDSLPISRDLRNQKLSGKEEVRRAMQDGEDYELLFTIPLARLSRLQAVWKKQFRLALTQIGIVRPRPFGIQLVRNMQDRSKLSLPEAPDHHFKKM